MNQNTINQSGEDIRWYDKLIPYYFLLFFLLLMVGAVKMVMVAKEGFSGQVMKNASEIRLNETNAQIQRQKELQLSDSWKMQKSARTINSELTILDKNSKPLLISEYKLHYFSPQSDKNDILIHKKLNQPVNHLNIAQQLPLAGPWKVYIIAKTNLGIYHTKKVINVK